MLPTPYGCLIRRGARVIPTVGITTLLGGALLMIAPAGRTEGPVPLPGGAEPSSSAPPPTRAAAKTTNGKKTTSVAELYQRRCQRCHEEDGKGEGERNTFPEIPDFSSHAWQMKRTNAELVVSILEGKGNRMPAFSGRLSPSQAEELAAFIRRFDPSQVERGGEAPSDFEAQFRRLEEEWLEQHQQLLELDAQAQMERGSRQASLRPPSAGKRTFTLTPP